MSITPTAVLFLAYFALLSRVALSGALWVVPAWFAYLGAFLASLVAHAWAITHPPGLGMLPVLEPVLIALKALMFIEAFGLATQRLAPAERKLMLSLLGAIALIVCVVAFGGQQNVYSAVRTYSNLALAAGSAVAVGCFWIAPVRMSASIRNHCLILTCYFLNLAVAGLVEPQTGAAWRATNWAYSAVSLLLCAAWWRLGILGVCKSSKVRVLG